MSQHSLDFEKLVNFNPADNGITIQTSLKLLDKTVPFPAKIDTGASLCIFERKHGEELGLEIESGLFQRIGTATGVFTCYGFRINVETEGFEFDSLVYFAENVFFNRNVLGRHGWLELVKLGLIDYEGKLFLSRYSD